MDPLVTELPCPKDDETVVCGKYKSQRTYKEIYDHDQDYVKWVLQLPLKDINSLSMKLMYRYFYTQKFNETHPEH